MAKKKIHEKKLPNVKDKLLKGNEGRRHNGYRDWEDRKSVV